MRDIKFRAWDKDTGFDESEPRMLAFEDIKERYAGEMSNMFDDEDIELMQYTGLKDKNGVEIYEGDIVFYNSTGYTGQVAYSIVAGCAYHVYENGIDSEFGGRKLLQMVADIEVIGNIYENPNLLNPVKEK